MSEPVPADNSYRMVIGYGTLLASMFGVLMGSIGNVIPGTWIVIYPLTLWGLVAFSKHIYNGLIRIDQK